MKNLNETIIKALKEDVNERAKVDGYYCSFHDDEESVDLNACRDDFNYVMEEILKENPELEIDEEERISYHEIYENFIASATIDQAEANGYEYNGRDSNNVLWFVEINDDDEDIDEDEDDEEDIDE